MRWKHYIRRFLKNIIGVDNATHVKSFVHYCTEGWQRKPHYIHSYRKHVSNLLDTHSTQEAMALAVGGGWGAMGQLEYYLLRDLGLQNQHRLIDVGCGSGRLAVQLAQSWEGHYVGIDIIPELLQYAQNLCQRSDWIFHKATGLTIPEESESADMICFFSVFTHLLHEESFLYLQEAQRVLKPGGRIIFSFLEFTLPHHWPVFENTVNDKNPNKVINQFMSREAIYAWSEHLNLTVDAIYDGDKPHIVLPEVIVLDSGQKIENMGNLGQSVCVLSK